MLFSSQYLADPHSYHREKQYAAVIEHPDALHTRLAPYWITTKSIQHLFLTRYLALFRISLYN
jgi:hypothetical protein